MHSVKLFAAILALGATAVSGASTCTKDVKVTEATPTIDCEVVDADIIIDEDVEGQVSIEGPKQVKGDFIVDGASKLISLSSTSINSISGKFELKNLESLQNLELSSLKNLGSLSFIKLPRLSQLNFGTEGVTKISGIRITDTRITDLSGLSVATVDSFQIDNNRKMTSYNSDLVNITTELLIFDNGNNMDITMEKLEYAAEIQISSAKSFKVPALTEVSKSIKFNDNPQLTSFSAPNLTKVAQDVSFVDMNKLTNLSFPLLESIGGGLTIENNTKLLAIDDFPKLEKVGGGVSLRGSFEKVELPKLDAVTGTVLVTSTTDIKEFCKYFDDLKSSGAVDGEEKCTSNNKEANKGGDGGEEADGSSSSSDSSEEDAAGIVSVNMAVLALAGVAAVAQLF